MIARPAAVLVLALVAGCSQNKKETIDPTLERKVDSHNQQLLRDGPASPPPQR